MNSWISWRVCSLVPLIVVLALPWLTRSTEAPPRDRPDQPAVQPAPRARPPAPRRRGPAPPTIAVTPAMLQRGRAIYLRDCESCHGADGRAEGFDTTLPFQPGDLSSPQQMEAFSDEDLARKTQYGGYQMPSSQHIRGDDMVALVAFVRSLSQPEVRVVELQKMAQGEVSNFVPATAETIRNPAPGDWPMFRRTYDSWAYSPLDQINRDNVGTLQLAWSRAMEPGGQYTTPLVYGGTMYLANPGDVIQALDAVTGDLIWEYRWEPTPTDSTPGDGGAPAPRESSSGQRFRSVRNIALFGDKIFHLTRDGHVLALDARTGAPVWQTREEGAGAGIGHMSGPIVADGKVIAGRSCSAVGGPLICFIAAYDVETGKEVWRTYTIARPGEPGDESWGDVPYENRRHVGAWGVGSYDPELNLIYWGTSVPAPSLEVLRGTGGKDVLYSNSTLAIDAATGEIAWYYQHLPRDNWDLDHVFERYLIDAAVAPDPDEVRWINPRVEPGTTRKVVTGIPGKTGIIYTLDRATGEFLWARETIHQNVVADIDRESGRVSINEALVVGPFEEILVCPSLGGGKCWPSGAYSPRTRLMYQPQQNMCMLISGNTDRPSPADGYATSWIIIEDPTVKPPYMVGRVDATSVETGRTAWLHQQRAGMIGSLVATAGGLVFGGDVNRRFKAFDDATGEVLWETTVSGPVSAHPISYEVDGRQFIAVPAGGDTASPEKRVLSLHPEIKPPQGINAIFVFTTGPEAGRSLRPAGAGLWVFGLVVLAVGAVFLAAKLRPKAS